MVLLLFRIVYACLSGLPLESLNVGSIASAVTSYFCDKRKDIQVAAINAGQFLIPAIWDSKSTRQHFVLSEDSICSLLCAFGKSMPVSSSLKLLHSFSLLPENCSLFISKGITLLSTSVMVLSSRQIEKELAFHLLKNLIQGHVSVTPKSLDKDTVVSQQVSGSKVEIEGVRQRFNESNDVQVLSVKSDGLHTHTLLSQSGPEKKKSIDSEELLLHFADYFEKIKNIIMYMDISTSEPFTKLKGLVDELEQTVSNLDVSHSVNHRLNDLLLGAIADLLLGIKSSCSLGL